MSRVLFDSHRDLEDFDMANEAGWLQTPVHERNGRINSTAVLILPTCNRLPSPEECHSRSLEHRIFSVS